MNNELKKMIGIVLLVVTCFALIGCNKVNNIDEPIGIRGVVKEISGDNTSGNLLVEGKIEKDTAFDKASVRITKDTIIQKDNLSRMINLSEIKVGDKVEVIFKGAVAESYPVQGVADIVRLITSK